MDLDDYEDFELNDELIAATSFIEEQENGMTVYIFKISSVDIKEFVLQIARLRRQIYHIYIALV